MSGSQFRVRGWGWGLTRKHKITSRSITGLLVHGGPQHAPGKPPSMVFMEQARMGRGTSHILDQE